MRAERELRQRPAQRSLRKLHLVPVLRAAELTRPQRPSRRGGPTVLLLGDAAFRSAMQEHLGTGAGAVDHASIAAGDGPTTLPEARYDMVVVQDVAMGELGDWRHRCHDRTRFYVVDDGAGRGALTSTIPAWGRFIKRTVDVVAAGAALVIALPLLVAIAIAVKLDSDGPALFVQTRVGADGRKFRFLKFRTMVVNNDDAMHLEYVASLIRGDEVDHGGVFKLAADPRITRVGRFLRRYSLDELPQLLNVLRGDMTLVGPRPSMPCEIDMYDANAWQRLRVKPGLTGLWQVSGRCELTFWEMVELDVAYWRQWTPWLDLRILLRTPRAVLTARGAV